MRRSFANSLLRLYDSARRAYAVAGGAALGSTAPIGVVETRVRLRRCSRPAPGTSPPGKIGTTRYRFPIPRASLRPQRDIPLAAGEGRPFVPNTDSLAASAAHDCVYSITGHHTICALLEPDADRMRAVALPDGLAQNDGFATTSVRHSRRPRRTAHCGLRSLRQPRAGNWVQAPDGGYQHRLALV